MDFYHLTRGSHEVDSIREGHRREAMASPTSSAANVVGRLFTWLVLTFLTLLALASAMPWSLPAGEPGRVKHTEPDRVLVLAIPVLFVLSLMPVVGPGGSRGMRVFGVIWAIAAGWVVLSVTAQLW